MGLSYLSHFMQTETHKNLGRECATIFCKVIMAYYRNYKSANGLTPGENRRVGKAFKGIIFLTIVVLLIKIIGNDAFNPIILAAAAIISFSLAGLILYRIGFWKYLR